MGRLKKHWKTIGVVVAAILAICADLIAVSEKIRQWLFKDPDDGVFYPAIALGSVMTLILLSGVAWLLVSRHRLLRVVENLGELFRKIEALETSLSEAALSKYVQDAATQLWAALVEKPPAERVAHLRRTLFDIQQPDAAFKELAGKDLSAFKVDAALSLLRHIRDATRMIRGGKDTPIYAALVMIEGSKTVTIDGKEEQGHVLAAYPLDTRTRDRELCETAYLASGRSIQSHVLKAGKAIQFGELSELQEPKHYIREWHSDDASERSMDSFIESGVLVPIAEHGKAIALLQLDSPRRMMFSGTLRGKSEVVEMAHCTGRALSVLFSVSTYVRSLVHRFVVAEWMVADAMQLLGEAIATAEQLVRDGSAAKDVALAKQVQSLKAQLREVLGHLPALIRGHQESPSGSSAPVDATSAPTPINPNVHRGPAAPHRPPRRNPRRN